MSVTDLIIDSYEIVVNLKMVLCANLRINMNESHLGGNSYTVFDFSVFRQQPSWNDLKSLWKNHTFQRRKKLLEFYKTMTKNLLKIY